MIYVGIDFSINSTGVTILKDDKFIWLNFAANVKYANKPFIQHNIIKDFKNVHIESYERKVPKTSYSDEQEYKINNAYGIAQKIIEKIKNIAGKDDRIIVAFEGFSYGSKGRSFIDLIAYNSTLKSLLVTAGITEIKVYSPSEIKKDFTGKGNCGKNKMFESFLNVDDKRLRKDAIWKHCSSLEILDGADPAKPFDDLVDSFAILRKLETDYKHS